MQRPRVILADEPVASLDPKLAGSVLGLLREIAADDGIPVLVSLHVLPLALAHSDRIVGLRHGEMIVSAPTADLDPEKLAPLYATERTTMTSTETRRPRERPRCRPPSAPVWSGRSPSRATLSHRHPDRDHHPVLVGGRCRLRLREARRGRDQHGRVRLPAVADFSQFARSCAADRDAADGDHRNRARCGALAAVRGCRGVQHRPGGCTTRPAG